MGITDQFFRENTKLPSPPGIALRLLEALRKDDFSFVELAGIIQSDPALAARVLTVVNSSFYSLPHKVSSIERALSIMGAYAIKNIALSFILIDGLKWNTGGAFDFNHFWKRSITAAVSAEMIAGRLGMKSEETFVTALLQNIGVLFMFCSRPDRYLRLLEERNREGLPVEVYEERIFGCNHQELSAEMLKLWGIPEEIYIPIRYQHTPAAAPPRHVLFARVLFLSDHLSMLYNDSPGPGESARIMGILGEAMGCEDGELKPFIDRVADRCMEIFAFFDIAPGEMKPFSQMLQEANEELSKLNFSYEKLNMELNREKMHAERLNRELQEANARLKEMSCRDGLTGLFNRRYLHDFVEAEMAGCRREGGRFSLLLLDVDHFKKINDTHGHTVGDLVLKTVSERLEEAKGASDLVARLGGEEFAVVLPGTDIHGAMESAERIRAGIEGMVITVAGSSIRLTLSVGVATYGPELGEMAVDRLLDLADKALYRAKNSGRNRVMPAAVPLS